MSEPRHDVVPVAGLVLAAGAGRRMGRPKALVVDGASGRAWVEETVGRVLATGIARVVVVVGSAGEEVAEVLLAAGAAGRWPGAAVEVVSCPDWASGMGASLRFGLEALDGRADAALVTLVDLPDVGADVLARVLSAADGEGRGGLVRAAYEGVPGHPVLLGADHWAGVLDGARGDRGARDYLAAHPPRLVECGDLATGKDVDSPGELAPRSTAGPSRGSC